MGKTSAQILAEYDAFKLENAQKSGIETLQTELEHSGLSDTVVKLQQELSEEFGIITFDIDGNISTIPLTQELDPTISTGTGKYTSKAFKESVEIIASTLSDNPLGAWFNTNISQPIEQFVKELFTPTPLDDLPPELKVEWEALQVRMDELNRQIGVQSVRRPMNTSLITRLHDEFFALKKEQDDMINQFTLETKVAGEVADLSVTITQLINEPYITATLRMEIIDELTRGSEILTRLISFGLDSSTSLVTELQKGMSILQQRLSEDIVAPTLELDSGLKNIGDQLFESGENFFGEFVKALNPSADIIVGITMAWINAQKEIMKQIGAVGASK